MLVSHILRHNPQTIHEDLTLSEALDLLMRMNSNSFIVTNAEKEVVGIFSTQDVAAALVPPEFKENVALASAMYREGFFHELCQQIKDKPVKEYMRKEFLTVKPDMHVMVVAADFLKNDLYIVPVLEGKKLVGIVTRSEIKKAIAEAMAIIKG